MNDYQYASEHQQQLDEEQQWNAEQRAKAYCDGTPEERAKAKAEYENMSKYLKAITGHKHD